MRAVLETVDRLMDCEFAIVSLVDEETATIGINHGIWRGQLDLYPEWVEKARYPLDHPDIIADVYRTGRTEVITGWDDRFNREIWEKYGHERYLRVFMPIRFQERSIGVVEVSWDRSRKERVTEEELRLLSTLMDQAAIAIQNARLYAETQRAGDGAGRSGPYRRPGRLHSGTGALAGERAPGGGPAGGGGKCRVASVR
jgi:GAF domain-containing protein